MKKSGVCRIFLYHFPRAPVPQSQNAAARFSPPLFKAHAAAMAGEPRLPCARGAGTAIEDLNAVTEGLYPLIRYSVCTFIVYPLFFCNQKKSRSPPTAVPDGVPNGVFSISLFCPTVLTARRPFRTYKALPQGKRYIKNPLYRLRRHLP